MFKTEVKVMRKRSFFILGGLVLFAGSAEAQPCALNVKGLQEAFATFCSTESTCCTRPFYFNEENRAEDFIVLKHRQCSRDNHPDKNPNGEEEMKQCNGGREILETHFSCLQGDANYRSWFLSAWPVEAYLNTCLEEIKSKPLTALELQEKKERIQSVVGKARLGGYGL